MSEDKEYQTEVIRTFTDEALRCILMLEPLFPVKIQDDEEKVKINLSNPSNINIFLKKNNSVVGYLLATPHNDAVQELINDDSEMQFDNNRYYIDKVAVTPEHRGGVTFLRLGYALLDEAGKNGVNKISSHVLSRTGMSKILLRTFGKHMFTQIRKVELKIHNNEVFDYMEMTYLSK